MQTLDSTIVNTALPSMARGLGESPLQMQSVVVAYSLTMAILIPVSGWLADRFGTRSIFFASLIVFTVASAACAFSQTLTQLVLARCLQGAGASMLLPVGRLSILRITPREQLLNSMSLVAIPGLLGPLIGPALGGWLVQHASWHWIFLVNLPVGLATAVATCFIMPNLSGARSRFDLKGYLLLAFGMAAVSLALDAMAEPGVSHASAPIVLLLGLISLASYWIDAVDNPHALFPTRLFAIASFRIGMLGNLFSRIGSAGMPFLIPLMLQVALGYGPFTTGAMLLAAAASAIVSKRVVTLWAARAGLRFVLVINTCALGATIGAFALIRPAQVIGLHIALIALFGAFNSIQFSAMNTISLRDLPAAQASSGNSMLSMVQMLAMGLGVAVAGAMLATFTRFLSAHGAPVLDAFHASFLCMGAVTIASARIFWQLAREPDRGSPIEQGPAGAPASLD